MNIFLFIILAALLLEFALDIVSNSLNLRALRSKPPSGLQGIYETEEYRRSQEYTRTTTRFHFVRTTFNLSLLLGFWFTGGFNYLDGIVREPNLHVVATGVLYIGVLSIFFLLMSLPFSIYSTFVIEERFGFNKTTLGTFVGDQMKGLVISIVIGAPLLAGIIAIFEYVGSLAWLYSWIVVTLFILVLQFIAPTWIMPLFNKFTPMEAGDLRNAILDYARSVNFTVANIFIIDGSKRSSKANAFFSGFGRNKRIALFDTLVEKHTESELVAVLAHEIGHYKKKHILQGMLISILHTGVLFFLLSIFLSAGSLYDAFLMERSSTYAGILFFMLLYTPIEVVASIVQHKISRRHEFDADQWAVETFDKPQSLIDALKKLSADNLSNLAPHPFFVFLNYTHPTLLQRAEAIQRHWRNKP